MADRRLLIAAATLRATAVSLFGVIAGLYLARAGLDAARIGFVISAGLAGGAAFTVAVTLGADRIGRRRAQALLAALGALGAGAFAVSEDTAVLAGAAFLGALSGAGRDRGGAQTLDQAILPSTTTDTTRTLGFAWYHAAQDTGHALGALAAALPALLRGNAAVGQLASYRITLGLVAGLMLLSGVLYLALSSAAEIHGPAASTPGQGTARLTPASRRILWRISALFGVDSLAGGFLTTSLLSYFFYERFGAGEGSIALLFFGARVANTVSHLAAAGLARRFGLVNTMVFTHMPSSLLLATVPFAPDFGVAAALFLLREGLVEMDVPTRQSYVMAVVRPEERTVAAGVTNIVRMGGWAVAPSFAGLLMRDLSMALPLYIGAGMKIAYDALLWYSFRALKPPEESLAGIGPERGSQDGSPQ